MTWHVLDVRAVWIKEFAAALSRQMPTLGWHPQITTSGRFRDFETETIHADPLLRVRTFPLQRGFAKFPVSLIAREADRLTRRLVQASEKPHESVLICCSPHYAATAEKWPGSVVYYVTDLFVSYGDNPNFITSLERRLCSVADLVCPNSQRIAEHLTADAGCDGTRIKIIPNATRALNTLDKPAASAPVAAASDFAGLARPLAVVIGNLAENTDWLLLEAVIERTTWLSWILVGSAEMKVRDLDQRNARSRLQQRGGRIRFVGEKPYSQLQDYARAADVAVLPYRKCEPTYSGSSTRFYEHLAAGHPILSTRGFEELLHKEPLLRLVDSADEMIVALDELRMSGFRDGHEHLRRLTSQSETWELRAATMQSALYERTARRQVA